MPKNTYGDGSSFQPPDPNRKQQAATPASNAQVGDYLDHMVKADQEYHARKKAAGAPTVRGSSSYDEKGNFKMPKGLRGKQIDAEVDKRDH